MKSLIDAGEMARHWPRQLGLFIDSTDRPGIARLGGQRFYEVHYWPRRVRAMGNLARDAILNNGFARFGGARVLLRSMLQNSRAPYLYHDPFTWGGDLGIPKTTWMHPTYAFDELLKPHDDARAALETEKVPNLLSLALHRFTISGFLSPLGSVGSRRLPFRTIHDGCFTWDIPRFLGVLLVLLRTCLGST